MNAAARLNAIPREIAAVSDYEAFARERLDDNAWTYLVSGAGAETTLRDNRDAFGRVKLRPRVLADVRSGHTRLELFGQPYAHPVFLAPVAYQRLFHPEGELASAAGAGAMEAGMVVSTLASCTLEDIAAAAHAPLWFQLYIQPDRAQTLELLRRAEAAGYAALVVTVDAPLAGIRNREQRAGFSLPPGVAAVNLQNRRAAPSPALAPGASVVFDGLMATAPGWDDLAWLAAQTRLPLVVKGVLDPGDALRALEYGAAGIVVSNHGGRILDGVAASVDALPEIVAAVAGRAPVLLDGGIRCGGDVFKALALGATAVMTGRPYVHGLATAGGLGVAHVLRILREELEVTMALCGCPTLAQVDRRALFRPSQG